MSGREKLRKVNAQVIRERRRQALLDEISIRTFVLRHRARHAWLRTKRFVKAAWPGLVFAVVASVWNLWLGVTPMGVIVSLAVTVWLLWVLDSQQRKLDQARSEARLWKANFESRGEFVLNAERALVASLERNHELELFVAGWRVPTGVWMDGEWFPVEDAESDGEPQG